MSIPIIPAFQHSEINALFENDLTIDKEILKQILALPLESLIPDLEKILTLDKDTYVSFLQYESPDKTCFAFHSICLLNHLKSESSLKTILDFIEINDKDIDFWFGDHITESFWEIIFNLGQNQLPVLESFLYKDIDIYSKNIVSKAISQMVLYQKCDADLAKKIYHKLLTKFNNTNPDELDPTYVAMICSDVVECGFSDLEPIIKELFDKDIPELQYSGNFEQLLRFKNKNINEFRLDIGFTNIFNFYTDVITTWFGYRSDEENKEIEEKMFNSLLSKLNPKLPTIKESKIGRNDPCSCGSGKKYKKCCGKE